MIKKSVMEEPWEDFTGALQRRAKSQEVLSSISQMTQGTQLLWTILSTCTPSFQSKHAHIFTYSALAATV